MTKVSDEAEVFAAAMRREFKPEDLSAFLQVVEPWAPRIAEAEQDVEATFLEWKEADGRRRHMAGPNQAEVIASSAHQEYLSAKDHRDRVRSDRDALVAEFLAVSNHAIARAQLDLARAAQKSTKAAGRFNNLVGAFVIIAGLAALVQAWTAYRQTNAAEEQNRIAYRQANAADEQNRTAREVLELSRLQTSAPPALIAPAPASSGRSSP